MRSFALALALTFTLALAVPALAQGPSQDGYTPDGPQAVEQTRDGGDEQGGGSGGEPGGGGQSGALPFTGMDLLLVAGLGAGLLGVGAGMRRLTRPADHVSS
ncbi:hypothetical protein BH20ACT19_BH20ACT19_07290 [soil metagenome]